MLTEGKMRALNPDSSVSELPYIGPANLKKLDKLNIQTVRDLLFHIPRRYLDFSKFVPISQVNLGEIYTVRGRLVFLKNQFTKNGRKFQIGELSDASGSITVIWFNQPFLTRTLFPGDELSLAGRIDWFGRKPAFISPEYENLKTAGLHTGRLVPIYPETAGISSKWLRSRIKDALIKYESYLEDYLPKSVRSRNHLIKLPEAVRFIHFPQNSSEIKQGLKRMAFDELLSYHLLSLKRKSFWQEHKPAYNIRKYPEEIISFIKNLPFSLTKAQSKAVDQILSDISGNKPMNRLLEGDVGSGKTVVAAIGCFASFLSGYQSVFMAPTQILAQQHYQTFNELFAKYNVRLSLITSGSKFNNKADVFIGTHALIFNKHIFNNLALVIIDEQHKFGVGQRIQLLKHTNQPPETKGSLSSANRKKKNQNSKTPISLSKEENNILDQDAPFDFDDASPQKPPVIIKKALPHLLTMTATPIPRTVALTAFGDLDLTVLDESPQGRIKPLTYIVRPEKRQAAYKWIKDKIINEGLQAFIVCPLIDPSDTETMLDVKAVNDQFISLKKDFKGLTLSLLHGRMKTKQKDDAINSFRKGKSQILVTTPVVEVGIDVPKANIILINDGERFGLAQLHQLRGRVGRGNKQAYCLVFSGNNNAIINARLKAFKTEVSGFKLAEIDLKLRGPGDLFGTAQHGFPKLKIADWQDVELIKTTRREAVLILKNRKAVDNILGKTRTILT